MNKLCNNCGQIKDISQYKKHTSTKDRLSNFCRECTNLKQIEYRKNVNDKCTKEYEKTYKGYLVRMYRNMKSRVMGVQKEKCHLYKGKEILPKDIFYEWALNNPNYKVLFDNYKDNGYNQKLAPSVDRINSSLGYTLGNIEFVTHSENSRRSSIVRNGKKLHK